MAIATLLMVCAAAVLMLPFAASAQGITDASEVEALKALGSSLGLSPPWDFTVDPCSNASSWIIQGPSEFSPGRGVSCTCSNNTCHIRKISVVGQNVEGQIPVDIGMFAQLEDLNLQANRITGEIPEEFGLLSNLRYLTVANNKLHGLLPRAIGNLSRLMTLSISVNNFTGTVPEEIGNLTVLRELYMDSSGLSGELPADFIKLKGLKIWNFFDNNFNGSIPDFIGSMSSLEEVAMYGNSFRGQIPAVLGRLPNLKSLEIGDVASGGSIPSSYNALNKLTKLSLRNCQLNGSIPELGNLTSLTQLDLSSNNLTGEIPASLPSTLQILFLGSNMLTGPLPPQLISLNQLDVSFNNLSGVTNATVNATVIGNMLDITRPRSSPAIDCLEKRSNCNNLPASFQFAINCGGSEITSGDITFSEDDAPLQTGVYYSPSQAWAVSSSGYAESFKADPDYFESIRTGGKDTADATLYQSARTSPTSLRYFGLGMVTGLYTVKLHFAEIVIGVGSDGPGNGRRLFDIYVQGRLMARDFNIITEAKGSRAAVVESFSSVNVTESILDIHLLWRGKGTCCAPFRSYGPLISAIEVRSEFPVPSSSRNNSNSVKIGLGVGVPLVVGAIAAALACCIVRRRNRKRRSLGEDEDLSMLDEKLIMFSYNELRNATNDFAPEKLLGKGGFSAVYKGVLQDNTEVAIKQLFTYNQDTKDFLNEVRLISAVQHRNLVKLLGCCIDKDHRMLVLEYLENNSLHYALLSSKGLKLRLEWPVRFSICVGVARGIAYLHEDSSPRIIHRDIKATNVLLDKTFVPKIADFGLAKLFDDHASHISTRVAGTMGYLAPEYALRGILTEKADVYSYGVLVLEIVSGRPNMDSSNAEAEFLLDHAWKLYEQKSLLELVDKDADCTDTEQALKLVLVALLCCQTNAASRPTMSQVVSMLSGNAPVEAGQLVSGGQFMGALSMSRKRVELPSSTSESSSFWTSISADGR